MSIQLGKYFSSIRLKLEWGISEINLIISEYIFVLMAVFASVTGNYKCNRVYK